MKSFVQHVALSIVSMLAGLSTVSAQEQPMRATQALAISAKLYIYAQHESDALALISAAAIRKTVKFLHLSDEKENSNTGAANDPLSWQEMLASAIGLAGENQDLLSHIEDVRAQSSRGVLTGAVIAKGEIEPQQKREFSGLLFEGGAFAEVYSEGRGPSNIDMFVYDRSGALVCSQTDPGPIGLCGWTPQTSANYKIVLENKSDELVHFTLFTN